MPLGHHLVVLHGLGAPEDAGQRVVVPNRDGIELVVVATGAAQGQPQESPEAGVQLFVDDVHPHLHGVVFRQHLGTQGEESGGRPALQRGLQITRIGQEVSRQLLSHEQIVGLVPVEGLDHVIPIAEGGRMRHVLVQPVGIGVAGHVQPVAAPALSIAGRGQETFDQPGVGARRPVLEEVPDLFDGGGKTGQIEAGPPNQGPPVGGRGWFQSFRFQASQYESVDGRTDPASAPDLRQGGLQRRVECPEAFRLGGRLVRIDSHAPGGAHPDPIREQDDVLIRKPARKGHAQFLVAMGDGANQQTRLGIAGDDGRAAGATLTEAFLLVQDQPAHDRLAGAGVTRVAVPGQERTDLLLEIIAVVRRTGDERLGKQHREQPRRRTPPVSQIHRVLPGREGKSHSILTFRVWEIQPPRPVRTFPTGGGTSLSPIGDFLVACSSMFPCDVGGRKV